MKSSLPPFGDPWAKIDIGGHFARARKEWIHTNGGTAYASSTLANVHTRRSHGLLVAPVDDTGGRHVIVSHLDATLMVRHAGESSGSDAWALSKYQFPNVDPADGPFYLQTFSQDPLPRWVYRIPAGELQVSLGLLQGANALVLRYAWNGSTQVDLRLRPLIALRPASGLQKEDGGTIQRIELRAGEMRVQPNRQLPRVCFGYEGTFVGSPDWWRRFEYLVDHDDGEAFQEDLWTPGTFEIPVGDNPAHLVVALGELPEGRPFDLFKTVQDAAFHTDPGPGQRLVVRRLSVAARAFCAESTPHPRVVTAYPSAARCTRTALMALPGLYLASGRLDSAIRIIRELLGHMRGGLIPAEFPESSEPHNTYSPEATLWLFEAIRCVVDAAGERHPFSASEVLLALRDAFDCALGGKMDQAYISADGLFVNAAEARAGTWMNATFDGDLVTPRTGCPIELSALWARGCETLGRIAHAAGDVTTRQRAKEAARRARETFRARFWCNETGYPYDVIPALGGADERHADAERSVRAGDCSVRPNAVIALAIDPECFMPEQASMVLDRARDELLTRVGLRTLSPASPAYRGEMGETPASRAMAMHQGSVHAHLLGFYIRAMRQSLPETEHIKPLLVRMIESCTSQELAIGFPAGCADGDPPHRPAGEPAQALSAGELLRSLAFDLGEADGEEMGRS